MPILVTSSDRLAHQRPRPQRTPHTMERPAQTSEYGQYHADPTTDRRYPPRGLITTPS